MFVEGLGEVGSGGADEGGAVSFFGAGVEGELADDEGFAAGVEEGAVHEAGLVLVNAHVGQFGGQPFAIGGVVAVLDAEEDEKAGADGGNSGAVDGDGGFADALEDCSHGGGPSARLSVISYW